MVTVKLIIHKKYSLAEVLISQDATLHPMEQFVIEMAISA